MKLEPEDDNLFPLMYIAPRGSQSMVVKGMFAFIPRGKIIIVLQP